MKNPAREKFLPLLSPYVDGELPPEERVQVEQHLSNNKESAAQVADFRAGDALMRHALDMQADDVDWKAFSEGVMARIPFEKLPLLERLQVTLKELFAYQRGPLVAGLVGACAALAIAIPLGFRLGAQAPQGYGANRVEVQTVSIDSDAPMHPVVMETESGDAVIWVVGGGDTPDAGNKKKKKHDNDESSEEELNYEPEKRQGDL